MASSTNISQHLTRWSLPLLALAALCLVGCAKEAESPVVEEEVVEEVEVPAVEPSDADQSTASNEITAAMAELNLADRTAAFAQETCPVSGQLLGSMGAPIKVTAEGQEVFLCCAACKEKFEADPQKYLAKLDTPQPNTTQ